VSVAVDMGGAAIQRTPPSIVVGGAVRSALDHLDIDRCPRCLRGRLTVDLDRYAVTCDRGCARVGEAVAEAARRLTGALRDEGEALLSVCLAAERRPAATDILYSLACGLPASEDREHLIDTIVGIARRSSQAVQ
jgi:hypothetical protein